MFLLASPTLKTTKGVSKTQKDLWVHEKPLLLCSKPNSGHCHHDKVGRELVEIHLSSKCWWPSWTDCVWPQRDTCVLRGRVQGKVPGSERWRGQLSQRLWGPARAPQKNRSSFLQEQRFGPFIITLPEAAMVVVPVVTVKCPTFIYKSLIKGNWLEFPFISVGVLVLDDVSAKNTGPSRTWCPQVNPITS